MKKIIILFLFVANYSFAQSVTINPFSSNVKIFQTGIGFDQRNSSGTVGIGTYVDNGAYIQTHTNHPMQFATNNSTSQMTLSTSGNLGIGYTNPTQKLHVQGNAYVSGNLDSDGLVTAGTLSIGGGTTISKIFKLTLFAQPISSIAANACGVNLYTVTGVGTGDTIILSLESSFSTLGISNVRASGTNQIEVKFCNSGSVSTGNVTSDMRVTVIK